MGRRKPSKAENRQAERRSGNWLTRLLFRPRVLFCLLAGVVLSAIVPMARERLPNLNDRSQYRLRVEQITINEPPRYVPEDLVDQVFASSELPHELSILDDRLVERIAAAFASHPWVAEVIEVRKRIPAHLAVTLRYRQPVAMVEVEQGVYPVDVEGQLLPPTDFSLAETARYPLIRNVQSLPLGPAGSNWGDAAVTSAARLAGALQAAWDELHLAAIDAPRKPKASVSTGNRQFELLTKGGSRILWGRAPGLNHPGELSSDQKIGRLKKYQADFGSFGEPHEPYEIDIRHWREISRRPLVSRKREKGKRKK